MKIIKPSIEILDNIAPIKEVADMLLMELNFLLPSLFDDIE